MVFGSRFGCGMATKPIAACASTSSRKFCESAWEGSESQRFVSIHPPTAPLRRRFHHLGCCSSPGCSGIVPAVVFAPSLRKVRAPTKMRWGPWAMPEIVCLWAHLRARSRNLTCGMRCCFTLFVVASQCYLSRNVIVLDPRSSLSRSQSSERIGDIS